MSDSNMYIDLAALLRLASTDLLMFSQFCCWQLTVPFPWNCLQNCRSKGCMFVFIVVFRYRLPILSRGRVSEVCSCTRKCTCGRRSSTGRGISSTQSEYSACWQGKISYSILLTIIHDEKRRKKWNCSTV